MGAAVSLFVDSLVSEEIRRIVARAIKDREMLRAFEAANTINRTYPNCGFTEREIADQVIAAAARAGVAVEIGGGRACLPADPRAPTGQTPDNEAA
jgi:hypothetical protein